MGCLITGTDDDDCSAIATDASAGARFGMDLDGAGHADDDVHGWSTCSPNSARCPAAGCLGWVTTGAIFSAPAGIIASWFR